MLQIDHIYEFFENTLFKDFSRYYFNNGIIDDLSFNIFTVFDSPYKIFFYDQEPFLESLASKYISACICPEQYSIEEINNFFKNNIILPQMRAVGKGAAGNTDTTGITVNNPELLLNKIKILVTSEISDTPKSFDGKFQFHKLYYFFHGFAAMDWFRSYYVLNYNKPIVKEYKYDYISFNRILINDRAYRGYFVSKLTEHKLLNFGQVSFGVDQQTGMWQDELLNVNSKLSPHAKHHIVKHLNHLNLPLIIDSDSVAGFASASIPNSIHDSFWHIVTETVFYYDKLHLTEKIFKPIVSKQPFMLLAAPGNLEYLKSYGFKTFDGIIDESYDSIQDPDERVDAVVDQLKWYCNLPQSEKQSIIRAAQPIIEHNFEYFYGDFKKIIVNELINNVQTLFKEIGYNDRHIAYYTLQQILTH